METIFPVRRSATGPRATGRRCSGFSLIEVLVTTVILAIGLLGLAAMQLTTMKNTYSADKRSEATLLASDILDRMRANRATALVGAYDTSIGDTETSTGTLAETDLSQWKSRLATSLPSGDGAINTAGTTITITIQWDDSRGLSGSATQQFQYEARL